MTAAATKARIRLMKLKIIAALAVVAMIAAAALGSLQRSSAPEVRFATLSGENFITSDLRGKVVLVNFWATSCAACVEAMSKMVETYRKFAPRGYETVAVAMSYDHPNQVAQFVQDRALPFKVALDSNGEIARSFGERARHADNVPSRQAGARAQAVSRRTGPGRAPHAAGQSAQRPGLAQLCIHENAGRGLP
jgi:peroxiredoxin